MTHLVGWAKFTKPNNNQSLDRRLGEVYETQQNLSLDRRLGEVYETQHQSVTSDQLPVTSCA